MKQALFLLALFFSFSVFSQISVVPKSGSTIVTAQKQNGSPLVIAIPLTVNNAGAPVAVPTPISVVLNQTNTPAPLQFSAAEILTVTATVTAAPFMYVTAIAPIVQIDPTAYIYIPAGLNLTTDKSIELQIFYAGALNNVIQVTVSAPNSLLTMNQYFTAGNQLTTISKVDSANNILTVQGYVGDAPASRKVYLNRGQVLAVSDHSFIVGLHGFHFIEAFSITTIPFKVRPKVKVCRDTLPDITFDKEATSGLTNLGLNMDLVKWQMDRYFSSGKKSTHKFSLGAWCAPSVEELDSVQTVGYLTGGKKSKQLFLSLGITVNYTYNDISLVFVPFGWDIATSAIGREWVYDRKRWWGFGIAVSPKIFAPAANTK